jgi:replicative DNA helicase
MNIEAETLGILLRHPAEIARTALVPSDFSYEDHRLIFQSMRAVVAAGLTVDVFSVGERLGREDGIALVSSLWRDTVGSLANLEHWEKKLCLAARGRALRELAAKAVATLDEGRHDPDKLRGRLIQRLAELDGERRDYAFDARKSMASVLDRIEDIGQTTAQGKLTGIPTGIEQLDAMLGGLQKSDLTVAAGRSSMGKTAWAVSVAYHAASLGYRVGIASTEMSHVDLGMRFVSLHTGISADRIRRGQLSDRDYGAIGKAVSVLEKLPYEVLDKPACTVPDIALQARAWQLTGGLDLLIVDYLQRLRPESRCDSRAREVGEMAVGLKTVARTLNIPVIALAQVNRECEKRPNKRPNLGDLRESGDIEHEADQVLFLYRDSVYNSHANPREAEILIEKNRHGPPGIVIAGYNPDTMHWASRVEESMPRERWA